jgi:hypothetical protein
MPDPTAPICHVYTAALITGRSVDMNGLGCQPRDTDFLANMGEAIPCIGSRCVKWVPDYQLTGMGWCVDNTQRHPFADPNAPTTKEAPRA